MKCPNCKNEVKEDDLMPSILTDSLLCCPHCKGKSKHFAVMGTDPSLVFAEAQQKAEKPQEGEEVNL